jgi:hypothetical protein
MAIKPILFNSHMVRAILDGHKTVTRRVVKGLENYHDFCLLGTDHDMLAYKENGDEYPKRVKGLWAIFDWVFRDGLIHSRIAKAPYAPGDVLWVRETWAQVNGVYYYRADDRENLGVFGGWCPSIHMPREAARIWLRVSNVSVERLQAIDEAGAEAEGCKALIWKGKPVRTAREGFALAWGNTIKSVDQWRCGWEANPWVWVIEFERCEKPEKCDDYGRF